MQPTQRQDERSGLKTKGISVFQLDPHSGKLSQCLSMVHSPNLPPNQLIRKSSSNKPTNVSRSLFYPSRSASSLDMISMCRGAEAAGTSPYATGCASEQGRGSPGSTSLPILWAGGPRRCPESLAVLGSQMRKHLSSKTNLRPWLVPSDCPSLPSERAHGV